MRRLFTQGMVIKDGAKMSKNLGQRRLSGRNGGPVRRGFGPPVLAVRCPSGPDLDWQEDGVSGINRFLGRVFRFVTRNADKPGWHRAN